jgi:protein-disulfide isomerase
VGAFGLAALNTGCTKESAAKESANVAGTDAAYPEVLATIGDDKITMKDVRERAGPDLDRVETQYRQAKSETVETAIRALLREKVILAEANKQGKTIEQLVDEEAGPGLNPTDVEIAAWFQENQSRTGGRTLETLKPQIAELIRGQRRHDAAIRLEERLNKERNVVINFQPYKLAFDNTAAPVMGKNDAPVQMVEFSDFQCPFCHQFAPTLKQVKDKYGDKVQIVYRQYPIPSLHPFAFKAAEASLCANEQGKFWEMHDVMFAEQSRLTVTDLKEKAVRLGMDKGKFDKCLDTGRFTEQVQKDMTDGARVGVTGTPAIFINGVEVKGGAVAFDVVASAIDKELARAPKAN